MTTGGYVLYRRGDPATSRAAAMAILGALPDLQQAVYAYAYAQGSYGFTDEEMLAYFKPGFHPNDLDTVQLLKDWKAKLGF